MCDKSISDLDRVCRSCLGRKGDMRSLFGTYLDEMLRKVADIQVDISDGLPKLICFQCVLQVSRAFRFKQQCQKSDATLRANLKINHPTKSYILSSNERVSSETSNFVAELVSVEDFELSQAPGVPSSKDFVVNTELPVGDVAQSLKVLNEHHSEHDFSMREDLGFSSQILEEYLEKSEVENKDGVVYPSNDVVAVQVKQKTSPDAKTQYKNSEFHCNFCSKTFPKRQSLRRHLKIHDPVKAHVCKECGMAFTESSNLTKHIKKHTGELRNICGKPNLCTICGKAFKWASSLSKHMNHHTKKKILQCPHCPKYYLERQTLKLHLRTHTGEKPFICCICEKAFTQMCNLTKHLLMHTGEKPYVCPICDKRFTQSSYIAVHMRSHTGEKPYMCVECGKCFAGSNTLAMHKRTHTGEKPFCCNICGKTFARLETCSVHQRTHTGEKPLICPICNRTFISSSLLSNHKCTHVN